jgi:outer membrane protein assembly factor BamB
MIRLMRHAAVMVLSLGAMQQGFAAATEWSEYRGPSHDGITAESVNTPWPSSGPKLVWKAPTPNGFSSFTVGGGAVYTQLGKEVGGDKREVCVAFDAATGKELWAVPVDRADYQGGGDSGTPENKGGDGPRSTPTYSDGRVYVYTSDLVLGCLDAKTGKEVWAIDMIKEHAGKNVSWKNAASPVIEGDLIYVAAGGAGQSLLGIDKKTGKVVWKTADDKITHATPVVATILGEKQVIFFTQKGLVSVTPDAGKELWRYPFRYSTSTAASPVVCGDIVYCSAGYDVGGGACKIAKSGSGFTATEIWRTTGNKAVPNHWSTPVYKDGYLYGMFSFKRYGVGPLKCVEAATGKIMWEQKGFGAGQVILAGGKVLALADDGELVVVDPDSSAYKEVSRFQAIAGKCWSTPAMSDGHIYVRSTKEGACFEVSGK